MRLYRFLLRPESPWGTPLRSDTLYGLLLWRLNEDLGPEHCKNAIEAFRAGEPPFVLSSALPEGQLPMPCLPPVPRAAFRTKVDDGLFQVAGSTGEPLLAALLAFKKFRKLPWLPFAVWKIHAPALSSEELFAWYCAGAEGMYRKDDCFAFAPHVTIDRRIGGARQGGLFFTRERVFPRNTTLHLYARTEKPDFLLELLQRTGALGFGRDASTGNGRFGVAADTSFDAADLELPPASEGSGAACLLLSACSAHDMSGVRGWYRVEAKRGKTGPGHGNPFKNPFLLIREGSILTRLPSGPYVLEHINQDPSIVQIAQPLTLTCRLAGGK